MAVDDHSSHRRSTRSGLVLCLATNRAVVLLSLSFPDGRSKFGATCTEEESPPQRPMRLTGWCAAAPPAENLPLREGNRVIPLRDNNPGRTAPLVTVALIAANVLAFLKARQMEALGHSAVVQGMMMVPAEVTSLRDAPPLAPLHMPLLTVFTAMFLHAGWLHLIGNMLYLWIFGDNVEDRLGHARFLLFYLLCGLAAAIVHIAHDPSSRVCTLGASGAVAGVLGAYLVSFPRAGIQVLLLLGIFTRIITVPAWLMLGLWFALQVLNSSEVSAGGGGVAYFAHIGGFVAGIVLVGVLAKPARRARTSYHWWG